MSKSVSYLEEVELSKGGSFYVQINDNRASISYEDKNTNLSLWVDPKDLLAIKAAIETIIEHNDE